MNENFQKHLQAKGLAKTSIKTRMVHLRRFSSFLKKDIDKASLQDLESYIAQAGSTKEYRRSVIASFRAYYTYLQIIGTREDNPTTYLARIKPSEPSAKPATEFDYHRALRDAEPRERLMLQLAAIEGMRRGEVAQVHENDLQQDLLGYSLVVHGKGSKDRIIPLKEEIVEELKKAFAASPNGFAFPGNDGGHLSPAYVGKRISRLLPKGYSMHSLRHYAATKIHKAGGDILITQKFLGHASPTTTQRYVHQGIEDLRNVLMAV